MLGDRETGGKGRDWAKNDERRERGGESRCNSGSVTKRKHVRPFTSLPSRTVCASGLFGSRSLCVSLCCPGFWFACVPERNFNVNCVRARVRACARAHRAPAFD
eukprot:2145011-Pleurochrysis_carterae.AAC.1